MLPPLWYQFPISGILEFYQSTFHLSSVHKKGSSDLFPGRGSWLRFTKCFLNNLPSEGEQRLEFSYCVYNIAAIRNRTTSQCKKMKKKPEHHVRGKKPATVDTEEPSVPAVSKNKPTLRQADSALPLHTGPRASSPSRRHSQPKEPCAGGNSSAHAAVTSPCPAHCHPQVTPGAFTGDALGPSPAASHCHHFCTTVCWYNGWEMWLESCCEPTTFNTNLQCWEFSCKIHDKRE